MERINAQKYEKERNKNDIWLRYIEVMEEAIGRKAILNKLPRQPGDVLATYADVKDLIRDTGYRPETTLESGMQRFIDWYRDFYAV